MSLHGCPSCGCCTVCKVGVVNMLLHFCAGAFGKVVLWHSEADALLSILSWAEFAIMHASEFVVLL